MLGGGMERMVPLGMLLIMGSAGLPPSRLGSAGHYGASFQRRPPEGPAASVKQPPHLDTAATLNTSASPLDEELMEGFSQVVSRMLESLERGRSYLAAAVGEKDETAAGRSLGSADVAGDRETDLLESSSPDSTMGSRDSSSCANATLQAVQVSLAVQRGTFALAIDYPGFILGAFLGTAITLALFLLFLFVESHWRLASRIDAACQSPNNDSNGAKLIL